MLLVKLLAWILLLVSLAWFVYEPAFEPAIAFLVALGGLATLFVKERNDTKISSGQNQKISGGSTGIQAGGNISIGSKERSADE